MARESDTMDVRDDPDVVPVRAFVALWWFPLAVAAVVGAVLGSLVIRSSEAVYQIELDVLVGPVIADSDVLEGAADLARTYGEVVESRRVVEEAVAASGAEVDPDEVTVAADAGRGSTTLTITVQAPTASGTPAIADAVVDSLETVVADARQGAVTVVTNEEIEDPGDEPAPVLSGSTVVVIDDGGGVAERQSLGPAAGGAVGAIAAVLLAGAIAFGVETRRRVVPMSEVLVEHLGGDLGRLLVRPAVPGRLGRGELRMLTTDERARHDATLTAEAVLRPVGHGEGAVIFVAAPAPGPDYVRALLQLAAAVRRPTIIVDPTRVVSGGIAPGAPIEAGRPHSILVSDMPFSDLLVPHHEEVRAEVPTPIPLDLPREGVVVLVFAPVSHLVAEWRIWARTADEAVVLVARRHRRKASLAALTSRVHSVGLEVRGGVSVQRRWSRAAATVTLQPRPEGQERADGHDDEHPSDLIAT